MRPGSALRRASVVLAVVVVLAACDSADPPVASPTSAPGAERASDPPRSVSSDRPTDVVTSTTAVSSVASRRATSFQYTTASTATRAPLCTADGLGCVRQPDVAVHDVSGYWFGQLTEATAYGSARGPDGAELPAAAGLVMFSGAVGDCGTGTVVLATDEDLVSPGSWSGQWWVVPDTGTDGLEGLTGGGTFRRSAFAGPPSGNRDEFDGFVDCDGATPTARPVDALIAGSQPSSFAIVVPVATPGRPVCTDDRRACTSQFAVSTETDAGWVGAHITAGGEVTLDGSPGRIIQHGLATFSGTIDGCGTGSVLVRIFLDYEIDPLTYASGEELLRDSAWELVPGLGTGELVQASGSGVSHSSTDGRTLVLTSEGAIRCR